MNTPRLLRTAQLLEHLDPKAFDLGHWACGTAACAVGHAALDPWFQAQGLHLKCDGGFPEGYPTYAEDCGMHAVASFYAIDFGSAHRLFHPICYDEREHTHPLTVAARIRALIGIPRGDDEPGDLKAPSSITHESVTA